MKLPENSLFAILLRSRWWVSLLVALVAFGAVRLVLHEEAYAFFAALPFIAISDPQKCRRPSSVFICRPVTFGNQ